MIEAELGRLGLYSPRVYYTSILICTYGRYTDIQGPAVSSGVKYAINNRE